MTATTSDHPLVSIITPVYNTPKELFLACKNSVLGQTLTDFEWLLLDDGSDDDTVAMLDEAGHEDPRMHVYHLPHGGVSKARNFGLDICKGRYITFVDADDTVEPIFLEHASQALRGNNADIAIGRLAHSSLGESKPQLPSNLVSREKALSGSELSSFLRFTISGTPLKGHTRSDYFGIRPHPIAPRLYSSNLIKDERFSEKMSLAEDGLFGSITIQNAHTVVIVDEVWYWYIQSAGSTTKHLDLRNVIHQFESFNIYCESGERFGWDASDLGMRMYSELNYRWGNNSLKLSNCFLRNCLSAIFRIKSFRLLRRIRLSEYNLSARGFLVCLAAKYQNATLLTLIFKVSSKIHSQKSHAGLAGV